MLDWEEMVSNIADGALDMSGSRRRRKEKKSTKLRLFNCDDYCEPQLQESPRVLFQNPDWHLYTKDIQYSE